MRYLARNVTGPRPRWWTCNGWGSRTDAVIFASGADAARTINGGRTFENGESYLLEIFGGLL